MENKLPSKNEPKNIPIKIIFKIVALIFCKGTSAETSAPLMPLAVGIAEYSLNLDFSLLPAIKHKIKNIPEYQPKHHNVKDFKIKQLLFSTQSAIMKM